MVAIRIIVFLIIVVMADPARACGWWGDSEMSSRRETATVTPDGRPVEHSLSIENMKLPGRMGYGIAVPEPGRAVPYLLATFGQPLTRINELKIFGFRSVIDLATPASTAKHHRAETQAVGMKYFNIPIEGDIPNKEQTDLFIKALLTPDNTPLLVYARDADIIAAMWVSYRIKMGSPLSFALNEGRALGLAGEQEAELQNRGQQ